jgi:uncharacterized LabA/DUF88 family protein
MQMFYLYVDGESHYYGTEKCWKHIHGPGAGLDSIIRDPNQSFSQNTGFPLLPNPFKLHEKAKFFFDAQVTHKAAIPNSSEFVNRAVYFSTVRGDDDALNEARRIVRDSGFEPELFLEERNKAREREKLRETSGIIIKPKAVDIRLAVRMLEDAQRGLYESCYLLTSDIDYLPVIEAVRRMGKRVFVLGFANDTAGETSPFRYVPDAFVDIGEAFMKKHYALDGSKVKPVTTRRIGRSILVNPGKRSVAVDFNKNDENSLKRAKEILSTLHTDLQGLSTDASLANDGLVVDASKVLMYQGFAQNIETTIGSFMGLRKELTPC